MRTEKTGFTGVKVVSNEYGFFEQIEMSQGHAVNASVGDVLMANVPGAIQVVQSSIADDRKGTDWWVVLGNKKRLSVDCKVRQDDCIVKFKADDIALETWSVIEHRVIGWTRNPDKETDYILWLWKDTGRWLLIPFTMLCGAFIDNWRLWRKQYRTAIQKTTENGIVKWHSECVFVDRRAVWSEIYKKYGGQKAA